MSQPNEKYYRERAILAIERGDYEKAAQYTKKAEKCKQTKRPTDKYPVGSIIRFAQPWNSCRDFYIVAVKITEAEWLAYGRTVNERNSFVNWNRLMELYWGPSYAIHVFYEANGKVLK